MKQPNEITKREHRWEESMFVEQLNVLHTTDSPDILDGIRSHLNDNIQNATLDKFFTTKGYAATPLAELYYRVMMVPYTGNETTNTFIRRIMAFRRNITPMLHDHVEKRRAWGGNVVLEWTGPTGMGKSSCMLGFMEKHNGLRDVVLAEGTEGLRRHIAIDIADLPTKLDRLQRGHAVGLDEQLHLVGDGARTAMDTLANLEETMRGTGIDIHFASPSLRDHTTSQGILEAISWSPEKKETIFLFKLAMFGNPEPLPLGYVVLPWCSKEVYEAYEPIKKANLERTKKLQFNASSATQDELIKRFFEEPKIQARFRVKAPSKDDIARWWTRHMPAASSAERESYAEEVMDMIRTIKNAMTEFEPIYGWTPTQTMLDCISSKTTSTGKKTF